MSAHSFGVDPITCHAWNKDRTELALSLNTPEVKVYKKVPNGYDETATLREHGQRVTGIDWAPNSNRIVTCGADRNAYVWEFNNDKWTPSLVILRVNRAATCVKWSPNEDKFAVGSGSRVISVCYFEKENDWWVSKQIKKPIRSTVLCIDWHHNNILLAAGSSDFKARVFSTYIKEIESKPSASEWGKKMNFGNLMEEFSNGGGGWVHGISFSPSGTKLAWIGHDASISVMDKSNGDNLAVLKGSFLPLMSMTWVSNTSIVAVGYDCTPKLYVHSDSGSLTFKTDLDIPQEKEVSTMSAMNRFKSLDKKATADDDTELKTKHQNSIMQVSIYTGTKENCAKFSTSGKDGQLIIWDFKTLEKSFAGLKI